MGKPYYADDWLTVYGGDCRDVLPTLPADSVDCVVTSPPYWGLRDYGTDGQLGLERTPSEYVANLVAVFAEVRRVCKATATVWLNLGDSFMPGKQLAGIPWRVAFALQADGWYLRSDIIWSKSNPMPESVTDRPTRAHEYVFLLTKSARYYFDADAVREPVSETPGAQAWRRIFDPTKQPKEAAMKAAGKNGGPTGQRDPNAARRNIRSVWIIATRPYSGAHFAVFPPELPERCIKAGSSEGGVILDPFAGSGTVGMVANRLSRRAVLIDLNPEYLKQQMRRNAQTPLGLATSGVGEWS